MNIYLWKKLYQNNKLLKLYLGKFIGIIPALLVIPLSKIFDNAEFTKTIITKIPLTNILNIVISYSLFYEITNSKLSYKPFFRRWLIITKYVKIICISFIIIGIATQNLFFCIYVVALIYNQIYMAYALKNLNYFRFCFGELSRPTSLCLGLLTIKFLLPNNYHNVSNMFLISAVFQIVFITTVNKLKLNNPYLNSKLTRKDLFYLKGIISRNFSLGLIPLMQAFYVERIRNFFVIYQANYFFLTLVQDYSTKLSTIIGQPLNNYLLHVVKSNKTKYRKYTQHILSLCVVLFVITTSVYFLANMDITIYKELRINLATIMLIFVAEINIISGFILQKPIEIDTNRRYICGLIFMLNTSIKIFLLITMSKISTILMISVVANLIWLTTIRKVSKV